jgi:hypothetical protein
LQKSYSVWIARETYVENVVKKAAVPKREQYEKMIYKQTK